VEVFFLAEKISSDKSHFSRTTPKTMCVILLAWPIAIGSRALAVGITRYVHSSGILARLFLSSSGRTSTGNTVKT
jgi:hypothetical protein